MCGEVCKALSGTSRPWGWTGNAENTGVCALLDSCLKTDHRPVPSALGRPCREADAEFADCARTKFATEETAFLQFEVKMNH